MPAKIHPPSRATEPFDVHRELLPGPQLREEGTCAIDANQFRLLAFFGAHNPEGVYHINPGQLPQV